MDITPVIPNGYNGPIKQLTCRICKHIFYLTQADYARLEEVSCCHECSLILAQELEKHQAARSSISPDRLLFPLLTHRNQHLLLFPGRQNRHSFLPGPLSAFRSLAPSTATG